VLIRVEAGSVVGVMGAGPRHRFAVSRDRRFDATLHGQHLAPVGPQPEVLRVRLRGLREQRLGLLVALLVRIDVAEQDLRVHAAGADLQCRVEQVLGLVQTLRTPVRLHHHASELDKPGVEFRILDDQPFEQSLRIAQRLSIAAVDQLDCTPEVLLRSPPGQLALLRPGLEAWPLDDLGHVLACGDCSPVPQFHADPASAQWRHLCRGPLDVDARRPPSRKRRADREYARLQGVCAA
jgi:hypothetical protein